MEIKDEKVVLYCGTGRGRSAAAIGQGFRYACHGKTVFVVRFLKGKASMEIEYIRKLEPEIKQFCFDKYDACYQDLTPEEQKEEQIHIRTGISYAKKVLVTEECDVLILDEVLDLVGKKIITAEELRGLIREAGDGMHLIMTGTYRCEELWPYVDRVTEITTVHTAM